MVESHEGLSVASHLVCPEEKKVWVYVREIAVADFLLSSVVSLMSLNLPTIVTTPTHIRTLATRHSTPIYVDPEKRVPSRDHYKAYVTWKSGVFLFG